MMIRLLSWRALTLLALLIALLLVARSTDLTWLRLVIAVPLAAAAAIAVPMFIHSRARRLERAGGMTAAVKARWAAAESLADVAELTAQWLLGQLPAQPGYHGPVDVDDLDDDVDVPLGMAGLLAGVNRAGMLTTGSQVGYTGPGYRGDWQQNAAVEGLIGGGDFRRLQQLCQQAGVKTAIGGPGVTVTVHNGRRWTIFGAARTDLGDTWTGYGMCGAGAGAALKTALAVVVYDPEPGRNDRLWKVLAEFAGQTGRVRLLSAAAAAAMQRMAPPATAAAQSGAHRGEARHG
jgi:hypothetical protein